MVKLIITADDYGYGESYDRGILEVAAAGAVDAVSAFATRSALGPDALVATGVEVGLHLDLGAAADEPRVQEAERARVRAELAAQHRAFEATFGRPPAYLDGHHHCHARDGLGVVVSDFAVARDLPVRSINPRHRRLLRCRGVATNDLLLGRTAESEPELPGRLASGELPEGGVVEWMVHPGYGDPGAGSAYDAGRERDLALLSGWEPPDGLERVTHAALRPANAC